MRTSPKLQLSALALIFVLGSMPVARSADNVPPAAQAFSRNAALTFWQAYAGLPKIEPNEKKLLDAKPDQPIDEAAARAFLDGCRFSIDLFRAAAAMEQCDWGLDLSLGPGLAVPHAIKCLEFAKILRLEARIRLADGDGAGAVQDLITMFRAGRMVSQPPSMIICILVQQSIDSIGIAAAAQWLPKFDETSLRALAKGLAELPAAQPMQAGIAQEKIIMVDWLRRRIQRESATGLSKEVQQILTFGPGAKESASVRSVLKADPKTILAWLDEIDRDYDQLIAMMALPYDDYKKAIAAFQQTIAERKAANANPLESITVSALYGLREKELRVETLHLFLNAAIQAYLKHPDDVCAQLALIPDPFGNGPVALSEVPAGVELKSKLTVGNKPVTLTVGLKEK